MFQKCGIMFTLNKKGMKKMIQKPKGTKDILPQDSYKWQYIEEKSK